MTTDWANEPVPGISNPAVAAGLNYKVSEEWTNPATVPQSSDWSADAPAADSQAGQWGGSSNWN